MDKRTCKEMYADHQAAITHLENHPRQARAVQNGMGFRTGESFEAAFYRLGRIGRIRGSLVSFTSIDWYAFGEDMSHEDELGGCNICDAMVPYAGATGCQGDRCHLEDYYDDPEGYGLCEHPDSLNNM